MPPEAVDLVSRLLQYSPNLRCTAVSISDSLMHHFFALLYCSFWIHQLLFRSLDGYILFVFAVGSLYPPVFQRTPWTQYASSQWSSITSSLQLQTPRFVLWNLSTFVFIVLSTLCFDPSSLLTELKGASPEQLSKLIPEHARKQYPLFLGAWTSLKMLVHT